MDPITGVAASAAGGGLFGLIGTALGRVAGYFETRQRLRHETERWGHETRLLELQREARAEETEAELALAETSGRWAGLEASMAAEAAIGESYPWVNAVRGITRPGLTLLLWVISAMIWLGADAAERAAITETATFAATAATLWWFGDRGPKREAAG
ncbi:MAG: hypothetical protein CME85_04430 [Henriciella sp.]|jgi:hypothetical protein|uniref:hypothetical protein n=1 Tax=Henriciella sp. TaxID=1968823 RepID=UPI000C0DAABF|nr:hypothetical protein [Henriciella sp.]MBF34334.1 hypothetical protein [Hyphomonadaceae bacterium]MBK74726.1 hypothetical protein [Henriciella sp.]PHR74901.1 MAG: hypothetical protein COA64_13435 [Henriciella sp.]|tara:strand:- start:3850 stop:4320 length:471 start_codon:yes stop_codon:yes gene_type:complete